MDTLVHYTQVSSKEQKLLIFNLLIIWECGLQQLSEFQNLSTENKTQSVSISLQQFPSINVV